MVYAGQAADVRDVMVNGRWLMRERALLTLDEDHIRAQAANYARQMDEFLIAREGNVLNKLVAIGGLQEEESFEIQVKAQIDGGGEEMIEQLLRHSAVERVKHNHYRQYDTYFVFDDDQQGRVRYREDDFIDEGGQLVSVRTRLTYTGPTKIREFDNSVLLSHSRFIAPADRPLRFYREYFQAHHECEIHKDRLRWHVLYKGVLFYVNMDQITVPEVKHRFIEIKSRTWSKQDAEYKALLIAEILNDVMKIAPENRVQMEYVELCPGESG
jgi:5-methylthioadenosine/S-adenosylhomocysteine deaminase